MNRLLAIREIGDHIGTYTDRGTKLPVSWSTMGFYHAATMPNIVRVDQFVDFWIKYRAHPDPPSAHELIVTLVGSEYIDENAVDAVTALGVSDWHAFPVLTLRSATMAYDPDAVPLSPSYKIDALLATIVRSCGTKLHTLRLVSRRGCRLPPNLDLRNNCDATLEAVRDWLDGAQACSPTSGRRLHLDLDGSRYDNGVQITEWVLKARCLDRVHGLWFHTPTDDAITMTSRPVDVDVMALFQPERPTPSIANCWRWLQANDRLRRLRFVLYLTPLSDALPSTPPLVHNQRLRSMAIILPLRIEHGFVGTQFNDLPVADHVYVQTPFLVPAVCNAILRRGSVTRVFKYDGEEVIDVAGDIVEPWVQEEGPTTMMLLLSEADATMLRNDPRYHDRLTQKNLQVHAIQSDTIDSDVYKRMHELLGDCGPMW